MNAFALIVLILALIGIGTVIYYAMICFQYRQPKRRKLPSNSDMGPLLNYEEDFNGNHEEPIRSEGVRSVELPEASAPKPEEDGDQATKDAELEIPTKSVSFQNTPECASITPSSKKESIALDIDEEPPVLDNSKSLLQPSHERIERPKTTTVNLQSSLNENPLHTNINIEPSYNAMSNGFEEDGLLVPESQKNIQKDSRKRLHAQRSAPPEGYIPHQQLLVQKNPRLVPKHVQFANLQSNIPVIVTDSPHGGDSHPTVRPKLKSPLSDPGTSKDNNIFVFGISHEREPADQKPVKKVKITEDEGEICDISVSPQSCSQYPAVGWVANLPKNSDARKNMNEINLTEDNENLKPIVMPLATSEISCESVKNKEKIVSSGNVTGDEKVKSQIKLEEITSTSDSDCSINDASNVPSNEERLHDEPREESGSDSSEPDLTEYSFERGPHTPDPAVSTVLLNEVSCYPESKIGLTNYVPIPDATFVTSNQELLGETKIIGHPPPTPTSDTKSVSPISSNDNSLDEIKAPSPSFIPTNVLGTPPQTPPVDKTSTFIDEKPSLTFTNESAPSFIVIDTHGSQRRSSSDSVSSSLSSSSSSNGSYKLDAVNNDVQQIDSHKKNASETCFMKD